MDVQYFVFSLVGNLILNSWLTINVHHFINLLEFATFLDFRVFKPGFADFSSQRRLCESTQL